MGILTIRQKQSLLGYLLAVLLGLGALELIVQFFARLPWLAWPILAALIAAAVWWSVRRNKATKARRAAPADPGNVPLLPGDTIDTLTFRILEANIKAGKHIGPDELAIAKELAARGLRRMDRPKAKP